MLTANSPHSRFPQTVLLRVIKRNTQSLLFGRLGTSLPICTTSHMDQHHAISSQKATSSNFSALNCETGWQLPRTGLHSMVSAISSAVVKCHSSQTAEVFRRPSRPLGRAAGMCLAFEVTLFNGVAFKH